MADDMIHVVRTVTNFTESKAIAGIHYLMFMALARVAVFHIPQRPRHFLTTTYARRWM
jgi:hypothetical protein